MDLTHFRQRLAEERRFLSERIEMINETGLGGTSQGDQIQEDSTIDNHPADLGSEMFEREKDLGLLTNNQRRQRDVDIALERMDSGLYGICEDCGTQIDTARLEVSPSASTCIECQRKREGLPDRFQRPIEEQVLNPPFGRSRGGFVGFDGEDALQMVLQYGTSETPQDLGVKTYNEMYDADEEIYAVVDSMDNIVDEEGEPIPREDWEESGVMMVSPESKWRGGLFAHRTHYVEHCATTLRTEDTTVGSEGTCESH